MNGKVSSIIKNFVDETRILLSDNIVGIYLFGSYGKNTQNELSDVDILIIVKRNSPELRKKISSLSSKYSISQNIVISPVIKDLNVWEKNKKFNTLFYSEIEKYGIAL